MINLDKLNENQQQAVEHIDGPCMVLAGPGSGKTRVITYRIANMVINKEIKPTSILAISFTKASSTEMKNRALTLAKDIRMEKVTYGTFHSVFFRILRYYKNYKVEDLLDERTKRMTIKSILKSLNVENADDDDVVGQVINELSYVKNELMDKNDFDSEVLQEDEFARMYTMYEQYKEDANKIDFDDMLVKTYYLLRDNKQALEKVRQVYRYILVDEFQDINKVQFECIKLMASPNNNIFIVGDEDQSIYGFRGARPDFLLEFENYFENTNKIVLDINYRSKKEIIEIANRLIEKNSNRFNKEIKFNQSGKGDVSYITPEDSEEEAVMIGKQILQEIKKDYMEYTDFAVIYRTNTQSRALVDVFMDMRIPFVVRDSIATIYDHWASKDILSYLKIALDPNLNKEWARIINKPFRYISKDSLAMVRDDDNFVDALINKCDLHPKQIKTINDLDIDISYVKGLNPKNAISYIRTTLDYDRYILDYCSNRKIKTNGLIEILNEIESGATHFKTIGEYLNHIDKVKEEIKDKNKNKETHGVIFTTMHSAKGLEFRNVFVVGVNEGTIPHEKSYDIDDEDKKLKQIEEERRLMYVAITRAEENICISSPKNKYAKKVFKSRFIDDILGPTKKEVENLQIGSKIYHKIFKEGTIREKTGDTVVIEFSDREKTLNLKTCIEKKIIWKI